MNRKLRDFVLYYKILQKAAKRKIECRRQVCSHFFLSFNGIRGSSMTSLNVSQRDGID